MSVADAWETMSAHYLPGRADLLDTLVDELVERFAGERLTIVELGSGPGSMLRRLAVALPDAQLVGVEIDPVLARVHQIECAERGMVPMPTIDADLGEPQWVDGLATWGAVSVVVAVQVLHYFPEQRFSALLCEVRQLLRHGGVLVHLDVVPGSVGQPETVTDRHTLDGDPWSSWWAAARREPALAEAFEQRQIRQAGAAGSAEFHPDERQLRELLGNAGFGEVSPIRRLGGALLTFTRPAV